ncbi:MAG: hypothetical protein ACJAQS_001216 [Porticoccus sp.]|jgi:hypothetical protein
MLNYVRYGKILTFVKLKMLGITPEQWRTQVVVGAKISVLPSKSIVQTLKLLVRA